MGVNKKLDHPCIGIIQYTSINAPTPAANVSLGSTNLVVVALHHNEKIIMYDFHDAKVWGIKFNIDTEKNRPGHYEIVIETDYPIQHEWNDSDELLTTFCPCHLIFNGVRHFLIDVESGSARQDQQTIDSDSLYIEKIEETNNQEEGHGFIIFFIDKVGRIKILCDGLEMRTYDALSVKIRDEIYIPLSIRKKLEVPLCC